MYRRAAGYFSSHGLALAARGVASLAHRKGTMRLVASPYLSPDDVQALQSAVDAPVEVLRSIVARDMMDIEDALLQDRLNALAWLAVTGRLEIKLALRVDADGGYSRGIFHEKTGIFTDAENNHVAFSGSSNETAGGLLENFESLKVFCSWKDGEGRVEEEIANFEALWCNTTSGLRVMEFSAVGRELLERFRRHDNPFPDINIVFDNKPALRTPAPPKGKELRPYQADAIRAWIKQKGKGILAMATGTGKTITALTLACKVAEKNPLLVILIVCPYINLCKQWVGEATSFGFETIECFEGRKTWQSRLEEAFQYLSSGMSRTIAVIATNATFLSQAFQDAIRYRIAAGSFHFLLIADEVHNLGAKKSLKVLPTGIGLRLGLSATPERHYDPEGTEAVLGYFGGLAYEYPLEQAIADGLLCPYQYHPVLVDLTNEETAEYLDISAKLAKHFRGDDDEEANEAAMRLLIKRARLLAGADNKLNALSDVINAMPEPPRKAIFYCGDGQTRDNLGEDVERQVNAVSRRLGEVHGLRVRNFTFRETSNEREEIIRDLTSGFLDGVVAIRCLDEGIDLPDLRMGFLLANTSNPRQFIQRRGRLLRNAKGKSRAIIYDFVILPPDFGGELDDHAYNMERSFFQKELKRIIIFCRTAENGPQALHTLHDLRKEYNLISE
ncbi:DEAD/DEAH box helicase family protein [Desulfonatronum thioautotrophicum]|uniref:DEAD/DEAH box helicase family protein n=1 Tax=Desulfonatronum thioautotrophicum TaxID=617001 RepID=UPI001ABFC003|nr:DEAD/DEAH box helicase family protein [Desulfonatronum thioautotrophicum]